MKGSTLFALPIELLFAEKARPRGVDLITAGKCPYGANSPVACMFCQEGHILDCHAGKTCEEAGCSHSIPDTYEGIDLTLDREVLDLVEMERGAHP